MNEEPARLDYVEFPAASIEELNRTRDFFTAVFGWKYAMYGDDYADTADSGTFSGINAENPAGKILPIVQVKDLDAAFQKVQESGGTIVREPFDFPGGRRFHFQDPAGNEVAAWMKVGE